MEDPFVSVIAATQTQSCTENLIENSDCSLLANSELIARLRSLAHEERQTTTRVLQHLGEIEKRMLHLDRGYPSLYEFCVKELGYSEGGAYRRISAMRLLRSLPEKTRQDTESKIESGKLTLSTVSSLQGFLRAEKKHSSKLYSSGQKMDLLTSLEGKSRREVESVLAGMQPALLPSDRERQINEEKIEIRFTADAALMKKLQQLKNHFAHHDPEISYNDLFHRLADVALKSINRTQAPKSSKNSELAKSEKQVAAKNAPGEGTVSLLQTPPAGFPKSVSGEKTWRYIPARIRREVWRRDQGRCVYHSPETGRKCESEFGLEFDHIQPVSLGGLSLPSNLRLLCRNHNAHAAVKELGVSVMKAYLPKLRG